MGRFLDRLMRPFRRDVGCDDIRDLSSDYVDDGLPKTMAARFRYHLASCQDCNFFVATFRATVLSLRGLPAQEPPSGLEERIRERLRDEGWGGAQRPPDKTGDD